ncbi:MAG: orotidine-5'-phosphate decarboxylase [Muribaculaceae bacterium]|jgi:orotidine-5'-phosphate decarboxylase
MTRQEIIDHIKEKRSFLCVGLDSDIKKMPQWLVEEADGDTYKAMMAFNKAIIDATAPYCVAYKPNTAFYEAFGADGWKALADTIAYIKEKHPRHFVIADAKRGDIGNTSAMYARAFFNDLQADAITVAPYMGEDSVKPFIGYEGKWVILLALTSNKGSLDFQLIRDEDGNRLFENVIRKSQTWGTTDDTMYVVGATRGQMFEDIRKVAPDSFLLVPGVGAQGGSLEEVCRYGMTEDCGLLVNSSRAIIYASTGKDFAEAASEAAKTVAEEMKGFLGTYSKI